MSMKCHSPRCTPRPNWPVINASPDLKPSTRSLRLPVGRGPVFVKCSCLEPVVSSHPSPLLRPRKVGRGGKVVNTPSSQPTSCAPPCVASTTGENARWFSEEVHLHEPGLKNYLRGSFPSVRDVDDIVQESYLHVWRRQLAAPIRSAKSFLYAVARNLAIDSLRHRHRTPIDAISSLASLEVVDPGAGAAEHACSNEEIELLLEAIESLPARCREIIILRKLCGLSQKEIAARLGIAERTVEVQGTKGLNRCEAFLRRRGIAGWRAP